MAAESTYWSSGVHRRGLRKASRPAARTIVDDLARLPDPPVPASPVHILGWRCRRSSASRMRVFAG